MQFRLLSDVHAEMLLPWQCDITTSCLYWNKDENQQSTQPKCGIIVSGILNLGHLGGRASLLTVTNINFLLTISIHHKKKVMRISIEDPSAGWGTIIIKA